MYKRQVYKKYFIQFTLSTSACPFPVPRPKTLFRRDLKNGDDLNNQTLWDNRPLFEHVLTLFCFVRRNFRSSPEVLQNFCFFHILFILHKMKISVYNLTYVIYIMLNWQINFTSGEISQISLCSFLFYKFDVREIYVIVSD